MPGPESTMIWWQIGKACAGKTDVERGYQGSVMKSHIQYINGLEFHSMLWSYGEILSREVKW